MALGQLIYGTIFVTNIFLRFDISSSFFFAKQKYYNLCSLQSLDRVKLQVIQIKFSICVLNLPSIFKIFNIRSPLIMNLDTISKKFHRNLIEHQCRTIQKWKYAKFTVLDILQFLLHKRFPKLVTSSLQILAMFKST